MIPNIFHDFPFQSGAPINATPLRKQASMVPAGVWVCRAKLALVAVQAGGLGRDERRLGGVVGFPTISEPTGGPEADGLCTTRCIPRGSFPPPPGNPSRHFRTFGPLLLPSVRDLSKCLDDSRRPTRTLTFDIAEGMCM